MSDLKWLRDLGEGRATKGFWRHGTIPNGSGAKFVLNEKDRLLADVYFERDGRFIAAAGTLWDKLVDVAEAAENVRRKSFFQHDGLNEALDALQAARKEVE